MRSVFGSLKVFFQILVMEYQMIRSRLKKKNRHSEPIKNILDNLLDFVIYFVLLFRILL